MKYAVKRYWELCDSVEVDADTPGEAIDQAHELPLDEHKGEFVLGSLNSDPNVDVQPLNSGGMT